MSQTFTDNYTVNPELNCVKFTIADPPIVTPALIQQDLYFGRNNPVGGEVSDEQFQAFLDNVVTPRFIGLTSFNAIGRFQDETNNITGEQSNVVTLILEDTLQNEIAVNEVLASYQEQFQQSGSLRVVNKDDFKVSFGPAIDLIDNDPVPELIQADLYFGRNIPGGGEVSEVQFQAFLDGVITPQFIGLTAFNAVGQTRDEFNNITREQSKVVTLILEDTQANENSINNVLRTYQGLFGGAGVLQTINEGVQVSFGPAIDLIDNDLVPELIQADLYFGRNIPGVGEVSEEQFLGFLDGVIAPRFIGLTAFNTIGQTRDEINNITRERSNVVTLILEDTQANEDAINDVLTIYQQNFGGAGVLQVIDENINAFFAVVPVDTISGIGGTNTLSGDFVGAII